MLSRLAIAIAVTPLCFAAEAAEIPRFDVSAHCEEVASFGGSYSESLFGGCMDMEQSAYDGLKSRWANLPDHVRQHCTGVARFGGPGSYSLLDGCIDIETSAARENSGRTFRY